MLLQEIPNIISRLLPHLATPDAVSFSMTSGSVVELRVPLSAWASPAHASSLGVLSATVPAGMFSSTRFSGGADILMISTAAEAVTQATDANAEGIRATIGALAGNGPLTLQTDGPVVKSLSVAFSQAIGSAVGQLLGAGGLPSHIESFTINRQQLLVSFSTS